MNFSKGFTLIELLVVIAIVGAMSSIVLSSLGTTKYRSNDSVRISQINQIAKAIELYYSDNDKYPNNRTNGGFMYADSRRPPLPLAGAAYSNLMNYIVPTYISSAPLPPKNAKGEGAMCGSCDEYMYMVNGWGRGYMICTYLAESRGGTGYTGSSGPFYGSISFGPYYCVSSGCGAGSGPSDTPSTIFTNCKD